MLDFLFRGQSIAVVDVRNIFIIQINSKMNVTCDLRLRLRRTPFNAVRGHIHVNLRYCAYVCAFYIHSQLELKRAVLKLVSVFDWNLRNFHLRATKTTSIGRGTLLMV